MQIPNMGQCQTPGNSLNVMNNVTPGNVQHVNNQMSPSIAQRNQQSQQVTNVDEIHK